MEVSFGKDGSTGTPVTEVAQQATTPTAAEQVANPNPTQAAPAPAQPLATTRPPGALAPSGLVLGDKLPTFAEIVIPRINLVQNIGQMTESFQSGELVFDQKLILYTPPVINAKERTVVSPGTPPVNITVLGFRPTRFVEKVKGGGKGIICSTEEQVRLAGGTLDYQEWLLKAKDGMKRFEYMADAVVAVRRPDHLPDNGSAFVFSIEGHKYLLALWAMKGVVYTAAAKKVFFTARQMGCLREGGYPSWNYNVTTREESYPGGNAAWVPKCDPAQPNTPEFLAWVKDVLSQA